MSTIFISYSTKDRATADIVYKQLIEMGYEKPFRDDHPDSGIPAGSDWEQELYRKLRLCKALIVLCSKNWLDSKWCFAELAYAKAMGKEFFPIRIDDSNDVPSIVAERQAINLSDQNVWQRLKKGLEDAKLAPHDDFYWDISECPYPGLEPFTENHAGVYFGRDTEIQELRETLNRMRSVGQPRLLYVVGASGSGKSSLVRAGLLPRLKTKETGQWCLFRTFRWNDLRVSGRTWAEQLAVDLTDAWPHDDPKKPEWIALRERYTISSANPATTAADRFIDDTKNLLVSLKRSNSTPLFILDQFEEVLVSTDGEPTGPFLQFLGCVMSSPRSPWRCVATVRSDFLNAIQTRPELIAWKQHTDVYSLPLMNPERFYDVIRRPAEKIGITFEPETLVDQIVKDTGDNDALPLLAFTLRELYEQYGADKRFTYDEYANKLGRLEGCLKQVADELLTTPLESTDSNATQRALQLTFSNHLVSINEQDKFVRRTAVWSEINPAAQPVLRTFIARRLLTSRLRDEKNPQSEQVVEVAHEALFRKWDRLKDWLDARRDLLLWRRDVGRDRLADSENWTGLTRSQLAIARDWPKLRREELFTQEITWIKSAKRKVGFFWAGIAAVAVTVLVSVSVTWYLKVNRDYTMRQAEIARNANERAQFNSLIITAGQVEPTRPDLARNLLDSAADPKLQDFTYHWIRRCAQRSSIEFDRLGARSGVLTLSTNERFTIHDAKGLRLLMLTDPHSETQLTNASITTCVLSPSCTLIAWSQGDEVTLHDVGSGNFVAKYRLAVGSAQLLRFSPRSNFLAIGADNGQIFLARLTDLLKKELLDTGIVVDFPNRLTVEFRNDDVLLVGDWTITREFRISENGGTKETNSYPGVLFACESSHGLMAMSPDGQIPNEIAIYKPGRNGGVALKRVLSTRSFGTPSANEGEICAGTFSSDGKRIATAHLGGYSQGRVVVWDIASGMVITSIPIQTTDRAFAMLEHSTTVGHYSPMKRSIFQNRVESHLPNRPGCLFKFRPNIINGQIKFHDLLCQPLCILAKDSLPHCGNVFV